jgi:putative phosphoribosyl transferase
MIRRLALNSLRDRGSKRQGEERYSLPAESEVRIASASDFIFADFASPPDALGLVVFAHGSGSSRHSPRNRSVAQALREGRLATLLVDLLTPAEEQRDLATLEFRFDIERLAGRLVDATRWAAAQPGVKADSIGYFGASTGSAAALLAAAHLGARVAAVVSRGGRPDLAGDALPQVTAATLLIVGSDDHPIIELNRRALARLACEKELVIVPGATHLFHEPGTLERVAELAAAWFTQHVRPAARMRA